MKRAHYIKGLLRKQDCVIKVSQAYCMTEFFLNNFADFSDVVRVKKKNQESVQPLEAFPISNISYCDKIMHARWEFDVFSAQTRRVSALDKHQNWSESPFFVTILEHKVNI